MTTEERVDALTEAQDLIFQAIELIEVAASGTGCEGNVDAYLLARLRIAASDGHDYLSRDQSVSEVIGMIQEEAAALDAQDGGYELTDEDEAVIAAARDGWFPGDL